jgi:hypothetical protein
MYFADRLNAELHRLIIGDRPIPDDEEPQFTGIDGLLNADAPQQNADADGRLAAAVERLYALRWGDLLPPACPGPSCLLHGMEHQHTGRVRRDGR